MFGNLFSISPLHELRLTTRTINSITPLHKFHIQSNSITPLHELRQTTRTIKLDHPLTQTPSNYSHNQLDHPLTQTPSNYSSNQIRSPPYTNSVPLLVKSNSITPSHKLQLRPTTRPIKLNHPLTRTPSNYSHNQTQSPPYTNSVKLLAQSNSITPSHKLQLRHTTRQIKLDHPLHEFHPTILPIKLDHPLTQTPSNYSSNQIRSPPYTNSVPLLVKSNSITPSHKLQLRPTTRPIKLNHPLTRTPSNYSHNQTQSPPYTNSVKLLAQSNSITPSHKLQLRHTTRQIKLDHPLHEFRPTILPIKLDHPLTQTPSNYSPNQTRSPPYTNSVPLLVQSNSITPLHELCPTTRPIKLDHPLT